MSSDSEATFLFADIAGFTALTEAHGDEEAVQLVEDFARAVQKELPHVEGEYVKTIGDALMLRVPDPANAVRLGLWITRNAMSGHQAPSVRVGGNFGPAIERGGDYFGTTINVAARVSALAAGGELLVTGRQQRLRPISRACSTSLVGGKSYATSPSRSRFSLSFVWTRTPICSRSTLSARWRSIQSGRSVACCSTRRRTTSVRLVVRQPSRSTRSGTPNSYGRQAQAAGGGGRRRARRATRPAAARPTATAPASGRAADAETRFRRSRSLTSALSSDRRTSSATTTRPSMAAVSCPLEGVRYRA